MLWPKRGSQAVLWASLETCQKRQFGGLTPGALNWASTVSLWRPTIIRIPWRFAQSHSVEPHPQESPQKQPVAGEAWNSDERPGPRPGNSLLWLLIYKNEFLKLTKKRDEQAIVFIFFPPFIFSLSIEMGSKVVVNDGSINSEIKWHVHLILC